MQHSTRYAIIGAIAMLAWCTPVPVASQLASRSAPFDPSLSPGDVLRITVWRHPEFTGEFTVGPDSALVHPLYQTVKVAGVPVGVAKQRLRALLVAYEQDLQLVVEPLFPVTVAGEVRAPNLYRLSAGTTVAQAVGVAGGATDRGRLDRVRVIRGASQLTFDLAKQSAQTAPIASGDQVLVARRSDFNFLRDLLLPLTTVTGTVAAVINLTRQ